MVGRGFGTWVDTWSSSPPLVSDVSVGYGGAWLARRGLARCIKIKKNLKLKKIHTTSPSKQANKSRPHRIASMPHASL
ncbi:hypothetical protein Hanom_Chr02g00101841 [Helianthus anomalus]